LTSSLPSLLISIPEGILDLGWGHPSERLHPLVAMQRAVDHMFDTTGFDALQYGAFQGFGPLLDSLASYLSYEPAYGMAVEPESLFMTGGASQALDMACTLFTRAGDTVFVEEPTYYLARNIFADHHLHVVGVPTDDAGLRTDALKAMLNDESLPRPVLLYTIPTFQNPTGSVLPTDRRQALVALAQAYGFTVVADEVYHLLHYGPLPPPPMVSFDISGSGCVISLGSFSKVFSPGLRLGWIQAHPRLIQRFAGAGMVVSGGGLNHFAAALVHSAIVKGLLADNIVTLRKTYSERLKVMESVLRACLPDDARFAVPGGGYFFWVTMDGLDTDAMLPQAHRMGVSYRPGQAFSDTNGFSNALRLCFALYEPSELEQAVERLAGAITSYRASG
jgi:2-aminoadipate transaminase